MDDIYRTNICGVELSFRTTESTSYTDGMVEDLRERMRTVMGAGNIPVHKAALLVGLGLCDELKKVREERESFRSENDRLAEEYARLNAECHALSEEVSSLKRQIRDLKSDRATENR